MAFSDCRIISATNLTAIPAAAQDDTSDDDFLPREPATFTAHLLDTWQKPSQSKPYLQTTGETIEDVLSEWLDEIPALSLLKLVQEEDGEYRVIGAECG